MLVTSVRTLRRRLCSSVSSIELIKDYTNKETSRRTISCGRAAANVEDVVAAASCSSSESLGYIAKIENGPSASSSVAVLRNNNSNILRRRRLGNRRNKERRSTKDTDAIELALDSVVKIFTVASSPNYFLPWQNKSQRETMGSGFVISGKKILTNAHVVADHTFVLVRKHGSPTKYKAQVEAVGHECDLAILSVESEKFWEGMNSLELGDIPFLQEAVSVVGYPQGGDNISVTKGVVSRVEPTQYVHGATQLMAIQIDAAINPGNSGGPAIMGNKVAGVAFQNLSGAENIGYIIPVPVIKHFIAGVEENGKYVGFCSLGLSCQPTENVQLRNHFRMRPEMTGVLVSKINPLSDAHKVLKKDDIVLVFDGVPVANDGTVHFRNRERITFDHLVSMKKPNETAVVRVLRDGEEYEFSINIQPRYFYPGFVISGKKILTNAHVVADHTFVLVRKHGSPTKYKAQVEAVGHECDLAILSVESEKFWEGMNSLELGDIPFLQEAVSVVGYPQGGDNISVTKGVVSRVEPTQYVHGATQLMAIQIDAAINPGNSGGPAIMGNKVAGVAFQNLSGAENIGYIIPVPVIKHFIAGVEENGKYVGFCSLGLSCQPTENVQLRNHFRMRPEMTGVLVSKINPLSDAHKVLKKDDIVLVFDGVPVANDGTVHFRNRERITFDHLVSMKKPNETAVVRVLRDGEEYEFSINIQPLQPLVPVHQFDKLPSYYIFAGLVFVPLTQPYLHEYGEDWYNTSPRRLCEVALRKPPNRAGEQFVILSQVLMDDINAGYERLAELQVKKVNGIEVENLKHLCQLVENCSEESVRFDLDDDRVVVLNYHLAKVATSKILKCHRIPSAMSNDLIEK